MRSGRPRGTASAGGTPRGRACGARAPCPPTPPPRARRRVARTIRRPRARSATRARPRRRRAARTSHPASPPPSGTEPGLPCRAGCGHRRPSVVAPADSSNFDTSRLSPELNETPSRVITGYAAAARVRHLLRGRDCSDRRLEPQEHPRAVARRLGPGSRPVRAATPAPQRRNSPISPRLHAQVGDQG